MQFSYTMHWDASGRWHPEAHRIDLNGYQPDDYIVQQLYRFGTFYESSLLERIARCGPRGGVFIDVGANIGNHSVYFGKFLADHVIAIEPNPALLPLLIRNLQVNGIRGSSVLHCGIGDQSGLATVQLPTGCEGNVGMGQLRALAASDPREERAPSQVVPVRTLDDVWDDIQSSLDGMPLTLLKVDVEGMEGAVLAGGTRLLAEQRPHVIVEALSRSALLRLHDILAPHGYRQRIRFYPSRTYWFTDPDVHELPDDWLLPMVSPHPDEVKTAADLRALHPLLKGRRFLLVDDEVWRTRMFGANARPFPERDGQPWGAPSDGNQAVRELDAAKKAGAKYIVFAWPATWWLDYYAGFTCHLNASYPRVCNTENVIIFELSTPTG